MNQTSRIQSNVTINKNHKKEKKKNEIQNLLSSPRLKEERIKIVLIVKYKNKTL